MAYLLLAVVVAPVIAYKAPPQLQLTLLEEELATARGAQCLDHSPAGYYVREQDPNKWLIFLQGGGLCVTPIDCILRGKGGGGSSKYWDVNTPPEGLGPTSLSPLNPFANFSHVWVPYCSGDTWLGKSAHGHLALLGMQMSGHLILETIVERLLNTTNMLSATDVVLSGTSAGGIGVYHHIDWFADTVAARSRSRDLPAPRVVGVPIEGMFFPKSFPIEFEQFVVGNRAPLDSFFSAYLSLLQDSWMNPVCVQKSQQENFAMSLCFDVSNIVSVIKTPLFIFQNRFDKLQIQNLGLCFTCKEDDAPTGWEGSYTRLYGRLQRETVMDIKKALPGTGFFMPSEFRHDENFYKFFDSQAKSIEGTSLRAAFESWYWDKENVMLIEPTCNDDGPCVPPPEPERQILL